MSQLVARNVCVHRAGCRLLDEVSLSLGPGRLHAVLGANGAGKSTLLRALAGEWLPSAGSIALDGRALSRLNPAAQARLRAVLPQQDVLAFGFTVLELVRLGRHAALDQRPATTRRIIDTVLDATDITQLADRRYPELSGGERRRAQLARVLAQIWDQPGALLLLDEPTHSLDIAHQHAVMRLLRSLTGRGFGVLASLHEINLAAAYADEVSLMRSGRLIAAGATATVLNPVTLQATYGDALQFTPLTVQGKTLWLAHPETYSGGEACT